MNLPIMTLIKAGTGRIRENKEPGRRTCVSARFVFAAAVLLASLPVAADLQTVQVGGEIRIRGQYWRNSFDNPTATTYTGNMIRWPASALGGRPIGDPYGGQTIVSFFDWDDARDDYRLVEQRTRLNIRADFSDSATAYTELESYEAWGEDFRSNYITAVDRRGNSDVEVYQAYIEVRDLFGSPLQLRLGRQEITLGSGWLVGNNNNLPEFGGLSFDAARLTWATDQFSADALWAKLAEQFNSWNDGDRDLFALYGSYTGLEAVAFDLYWILLRDSAYLEDTDATWLGEQIEGWLGLDDYETTYLHTIGGRVHGESGGFDYNLEGAYQFGNASRVGALFRPFGYGDADADFGAWAGDLELGYTFDHRLQPRVWLGAAYFGGEDERDITFWEWLNPFAMLVEPEASLSFNRLFSDKTYSAILDDQGALTNFWTMRGGLSMAPTESTRVGLDAAWFEALEAFEQPIHIHWGRARIPILAPLSFWTTPSDKELGWELGLWGEYAYSEDLVFRAGWRHFFTGDGSAEGNFVDLNGLLHNGGTDDQDADYLYLESRVTF